ncbi:MAG: glycoside hydrolase family 2 protein [Kiritimatiellae bacterium]|nr:glycoside hydrolase family 2 protein [Kiritimatiellia bacterium]
MNTPSSAVLDLAGVWTLRASDPAIAPMPAAVPGDNYSALQAAGAIPDPYWRDNEERVQWVADKDWVFTREFEVTPGLLGHRAVYLSFDCIDTVAEVFVNGRRAGAADNQFRRWRYEVRGLLRPGSNTVEVRIASPRRSAMAEHDSSASPVEAANCNDGSIPGINFLRKSQCSAGWDWGIALPTSGIYGGVSLFGADDAVVDAVWCEQTHRPGSCRVDVVVRLLPAKGARPGTVVSAKVAFDGEERVVEGRVPASRKAFELRTTYRVASPRLWWPNGYGDQPLYPLCVTLGGQRVERGIGLRRIEVVRKPDHDGASFLFRVNGVDVFVKGADWIPSDARPAHETPDRIRDLLASAVEANMNMLRVWGGGHFEDDFFYDECDRLGIMLWHDMMFACMRYPVHRKFLDSVREEVLRQVRRLRDHASIAIWCGDNECIGAVGWGCWGKAEYRRRLKRYVRLNDTIRDAVAETDASRLFWPSSPCAEPDNFKYNDGNSGRGDTHYWAVWHGGARFDAYYNHRPRFCSEFGFQSFPSLETVRTYASEADGDFNLFSSVMDVHQKHGSGNSIILGMFGAYFRMPKGFAETLYLSQVQQAEAIRTGAEYWRSLRPYCMGTVFWQLNDNWPVASWSSLEYGGRWKALHNAARRFYAPLATFAFRPGWRAGIEAHLVWDLPLAMDAKVTVTLRRVADGSAVGSWEFHEKLAKAASRPLKLPSLVAAPLPDRTKRGINVGNPDPDPATLFLDIVTDGTDAQGKTYHHENTVFLDVWKRCDLPKAGLAVASVRPSADEPGAFDVTLSAKAPAFFAWLAVEGDPKGRFSDNLLTVLPGRRTVRYRPATRMTAADLRRRLSLMDLRETY